MSSSDRDQQRYNALKHAVVDIGFIRRGSVLRRFMPCGTAGCSCRATPPVLHGPYYQWTRKVRGKTMTVRLTREEANLLMQWISNSRQLDKIVAQMESVSMRITERLLRKSKKS